MTTPAGAVNTLFCADCSRCLPCAGRLRGGWPLAAPGRCARGWASTCRTTRTLSAADLHVVVDVYPARYQPATLRLDRTRIAGLLGILAGVGDGAQGLASGDLTQLDTLRTAMAAQSRELDGLLSRSVDQKHMESGDITLF